MDAIQAFKNVAEVVSVYKGTLKEHQILQESLKIISETIKNQKDTPEVKSE